MKPVRVVRFYWVWEEELPKAIESLPECERIVSVTGTAMTLAGHCRYEIETEADE